MIILGMTLLINLPLIIQTPMGKFSENSPPSDQTFPNKNFFQQRRSALLENLDLQWEKITIISTQTNTLQIFTIILYFHLAPECSAVYSLLLQIFMQLRKVMSIIKMHILLFFGSAFLFLMQCSTQFSLSSFYYY